MPAVAQPILVVFESSSTYMSVHARLVALSSPLCLHPQLSVCECERSVYVLMCVCMHAYACVRAGCASACVRTRVPLPPIAMASQRGDDERCSGGCLGRRCCCECRRGYLDDAVIAAALASVLQDTSQRHPARRRRCSCRHGACRCALMTLQRNKTGSSNLLSISRLRPTRIHSAAESSGVAWPCMHACMNAVHPPFY
jgi:hypothetical protein